MMAAATDILDGNGKKRPRQNRRGRSLHRGGAQRDWELRDRKDAVPAGDSHDPSETCSPDPPGWTMGPPAPSATARSIVKDEVVEMGRLPVAALGALTGLPTAVFMFLIFI
jgi:hypothetical protein